jgi:hypothetical protein
MLNVLKPTCVVECEIEKQIKWNEKKKEIEVTYTLIVNIN